LPNAGDRDVIVQCGMSPTRNDPSHVARNIL
jgi:hypothetical protein